MDAWTFFFFSKWVFYRAFQASRRAASAQALASALACCFLAESTTAILFAKSGVEDENNGKNHISSYPYFLYYSTLFMIKYENEMGNKKVCIPCVFTGFRFIRRVHISSVFIKFEKYLLDTTYIPQLNRWTSQFKHRKYEALIIFF